MSYPSVEIIVLSWNGVQDTLECLESLRSVDYSNRKVLVVDNGSTDDTASIVRSAFPEVDVLETGQNLGYAGGNNVGIERAIERGADAVLLLNNDTIAAPDFLSSLVATLYRSQDIAAANPLIYYYDKPRVIWSAGGSLDHHTGIAYQRHIDEMDIGQFLDEEDVDYGVGAALLMRREAIETVGLLDPAYFLYYEESDWCHRARDAGYRIVLSPHSRVWHKVSRTLEGRSATQLYYFCRNRLRFLNKQGRSRARLLGMSVFEFGRMWAAMRVRGDHELARAVVEGVRDFYLGRTGKAHG